MFRWSYNVRGNGEVAMTQLKVRAIGNSLGVVLQKEILAAYGVSCWLRRNWNWGDPLAAALKVSWPGLSRPSTWFGASSARKQPAEAESLAFVGLCGRPRRYEARLCSRAAWTAVGQARP